MQSLFDDYKSKPPNKNPNNQKDEIKDPKDPKDYQEDKKEFKESKMDQFIDKAEEEKIPNEFKVFNIQPPVNSKLDPFSQKSNELAQNKAKKNFVKV